MYFITEKCLVKKEKEIRPRDEGLSETFSLAPSHVLPYIFNSYHPPTGNNTGLYLEWGEPFLFCFEGENKLSRQYN